MDILGISAFYPSPVAGPGVSTLCSPLPGCDPLRRVVDPEATTTA
jgi:hypothetical protein